MQQERRWPLSAQPRMERHFVQADAPHLKTLEHSPSPFRQQGGAYEIGSPGRGTLARSGYAESPRCLRLEPRLNRHIDQDDDRINGRQLMRPHRWSRRSRRSNRKEFTPPTSSVKKFILCNPERRHN